MQSYSKEQIVNLLRCPEHLFKLVETLFIRHFWFSPSFSSPVCSPLSQQVICLPLSLFISALFSLSRILFIFSPSICLFCPPDLLCSFSKTPTHSLKLRQNFVSSLFSSSRSRLSQGYYSSRAFSIAHVLLSARLTQRTKHSQIKCV